MLRISMALICAVLAATVIHDVDMHDGGMSCHDGMKLYAIVSADKVEIGCAVDPPAALTVTEDAKNVIIEGGR